MTQNKKTAGHILQFLVIYPIHKERMSKARVIETNGINNDNNIQNDVNKRALGKKDRIWGFQNQLIIVFSVSLSKIWILLGSRATLISSCGLAVERGLTLAVSGIPSHTR